MTSRAMDARRFAARAIDETLVLAIQAAFVLVAAVLVGLSQLSTDDDQTEVAALSLGIIACGWLAGVTYEIGSTRWGPSVGKRWLRLRVRDMDSGGAPSWRQAVLRWLLVAGVQPLVWLSLGIGGNEPALARLGLTAGVALSLLWRAVLAVSVLRSRESIGIHDRVARTRVVPSRRSPS